MSAETIKELLARRPFQPFAVHMSSGERYEVRHPEFAMLLRTNLIIGFPESDRFAICALLHMADVELLERQTA